MTYKILAVDDHPQTLDIVIITLQQHGYLTVGTNSSVEAVSIAEKELPDLILLDMNMPQMNGKEVCRRLRAHPRFSDVPIIMFSAEAAEKLAGFEAGADDFLVKPTDPDEMIARIEALLENRPENNAGSNPTAPGAQEVSPAAAGSPHVAAPDAVAMASSMQAGRLIAIVGARGGSGATTLATNLALASAQIGTRTVLVDLDMVQGHVGLYLKVKRSGGLNALTDLSNLQLIQGVSKVLVDYQKGLRLLLAAPNLSGTYRTPAPDQVELALSTLRTSNQCVVVDLGGDLTAVARAALWEADQVIVCLRPERVALSAARRLMHHLREIVPSGTSVRPMIFGTTGGMNLPKGAAEKYLGHRVVAVIPALPLEMNRALNQGATFVQLYPTTKVAKWFRWFAKQVIQEPEAR